jgi:hypothetical protein
MVTPASAVTFWQRVKGWGQRAAHQQGASDADADRRVWVRYPADLETTLRPEGSPEAGPLAARVRNISRGGINLVVRRPFETGDLVTVELPSTEADTRYTVLACVVHVRALADGAWALGCTFSGELSADDLAVFGAQRTRPAPSDQRTWDRYPCTVTASYELLLAPERGRQAAQVLNISATGVGLRVHQAVEAGTLLSVDLYGAGGGHAPTLLACVVHVSARPGGEWALGCNFIRELSEPELAALV